MAKAPFPSIISSHILADFRSCPTKCARSHFQEWKPKLQSIHLHAGGAFAKGLEVTRRSFYEQGKGVEDSVSDGVRALLVAYGDFDAQGHAKSAERMAEALVFYFGKWPLGADKPPYKFANGSLGIEFAFATPLPFAHPVTQEPILYSGRADMICDVDGAPWVEDDKTATQLGNSWLNQWRLRSQFTGYCWSAQQAGIEVKGVNVRGVSILKTSYGNAEGIYARPQWMIDQWLEQVIRDLTRMEQAWESGKWDLNLDEACASYGGCEFLESCESSSPMSWLPMQFERRHYDPISRVETVLEGECPEL